MLLKLEEKSKPISTPRNGLKFRVFCHQASCKMVFVIGLALIIAVGQKHFVEAISCYSCVNVTSIPACTATKSCPDNWVCYSEYVTDHGKRLYTLGCRPQSYCSASNNRTSSPIVGRAAPDNTTCTDCCIKGLCNRQLCQVDVANCADMTGYNCAMFGAVYTICNDLEHSKGFCRRYCGLCDTVDGGWTTWGTWSSCDVTCGNGTRTKTRTCTNPAPANGGNDCLGIRKMHESCMQRPCPVHGGWSRWTEWGPCSVSCDVGIQKRDRTCSNPYPAYNGDPCLGDFRNDQLCFPGACTNGTWSAWSTWSSCSATCDGGYKLRTRACNNPSPSIAGEYCPGASAEATNCTDKPCYARVFYAKTLSTLSPSINTNLVFTQVIQNVGNGYNHMDGYFTAPEDGLYAFELELCIPHGRTVIINIEKNNQVMKSLFIHTGYDTCHENSVTDILKKGDKVSVKEGSGSYSYTTLYHDPHTVNSFRGYLARFLTPMFGS